MIHTDLNHDDRIAPIIALNLGPMWSDKTTMALYYADRYKRQRLEVVYIQPSWDTRHGDPSRVVSHSNFFKELPDLEVIVVDRGDEFSIPSRVKSYDVVFIDECQAFELTLVHAVRDLFYAGKCVIINGLDLTWEGRIFATSASLMAMPEKTLFRKTGACLYEGCRRSALFSQMLDPDGKPFRVFSDAPVDIPGGKDRYRVRCWKHWVATTPGVAEELARGEGCRLFTVHPGTIWSELRKQAASKA